MGVAISYIWIGSNFFLQSVPALVGTDMRGVRQVAVEMRGVAHDGRAARNQTCRSSVKPRPSARPMSQAARRLRFRNLSRRRVHRERNCRGSNHNSDFAPGKPILD